MKKLLALSAAALFLAFPIHSSAETPPSFTAFLEQSGTVACSEFPSVSCELSAVAWVKDGKNSFMIFGNDKPPKSAKEASVFTLPYEGGALPKDGMRSFFAFPPFSQANKFESFALTPDGKYMVASTAFDRYHETDYGLDKFNMLIAWPSTNSSKAVMVASSERDGIVSSRTLKLLLGKAIRKKYGDQATYFKVEGLALRPDNQILFAVREVGVNYSAFDYKIAIIAGKYKIKQNEFSLDESAEFEVVRDFSDAFAEIGRKVGVSSIEYDAEHKRLFLLTSFEDNEDKTLGAYLWVIPDQDGGLGKKINLVRTIDGAPFEFPHKAEGIAVLGGGRVFVIHDDDRYVTNVRIDGLGGTQLRARKTNEAPFDILRICGGGVSSPNCPGKN